MVMMTYNIMMSSSIIIFRLIGADNDVSYPMLCVVSTIYDNIIMMYDVFWTTRACRAAQN